MMMDMKTKLVGIDASTNRTGMSLFDGTSLMSCRLIDKSKIKNKDERIEAMMLSIADVLDEWNPDVVYQEDTWLGRNAETDQMLSSILGAVRFWCVKNGKAFHKIKPVSWRSVIGLAAKAVREQAKKESVEYAANTYGYDVGDDEADAICVGVAGVKLEGIE